MDQTCAICRSGVSLERNELNSLSVISCERCGHYLISDPALDALGREAPTSGFRAVLSEWVDSQNSFADTPTITGSKLDELRQLPILPFMERAKRLLILIANRTHTLGWNIDVLSDPKILAKLQAAKRKK